MKTGPAIPVFRSFDEAKSRAVYVDYPGFTWDNAHRSGKTAPLYAVLSKGPLRLHATEHHGGATPGSTVIVDVLDAQAVPDDPRSRGHPNANLEGLPWGKLVTVKDPFGNTLRFLGAKVGTARAIKDPI
ncbi:glyoxalase superfamily protein [Sedimentitalea nanhaiensis]|uniref:VOC domain-containing protein n=1 Tax=Sedimentitalea nanhaiensis TaxID=999627 RepID=A0A1I7DWL2_9RHOB|nr:glyoxalase superfamily protein [Sedimentitalea nanhaiensis]SFU16025.1 hypothetical protein SAMN05216236_13634 [Sedimentitalea nanhaiensis]